MRTAVLAATVACGTWVLGGCGSGDAYKPVDKGVKVAPAPEHSHDHGPHGGHVIELGKHEYHAELVFDGKSRTTTLYLTGPDLKTPAPTDAKEIEMHAELDGKEVELIFAPQPESGDPQGQASKFVLAADKLPAEIKDVEDFHGHLHVSIGGKMFGGDVKHDHGHTHAHGAGHEHGAEKPAGGKTEGTSPEAAKPEAGEAK